MEQENKPAEDKKEMKKKNPMQEIEIEKILNLPTE